MINRQKNNKTAGFSMIELIIVIAIMALMIGGSFTLFGLLANGDSKKAVKNISTRLTDLRTNTLSVSGNWTAEIYMVDNQYKIDIKRAFTEEVTKPDGTKTMNSSTTTESSTIIGSKINISYKDLENVYTIDESNRLVISFKQGNGAIDDVKLVTISEKPSLIGGASKNGQIIVSIKSSLSSNALTLWYLTGKITTDY